MTDLSWAPYDESTYAPALAWLRAEDVVVDIGAGDLRFARRAAARVRRVIAVERTAAHVGPQASLPGNLTLVLADARTWPFPPDLTVGVLLMRHSPDFRLYADKLRAVGAARLITNARWGMGVECADLHTPPVPYASIESTWYACACGATGFAPGRTGAITPATLARVAEVTDCPVCGQALSAALARTSEVVRTTSEVLAKAADSACPQTRQNTSMPGP
jgi:hypothetical protein